MRSFAFDNDLLLLSDYNMCSRIRWLSKPRVMISHDTAKLCTVDNANLKANNNKFETSFYDFVPKILPPDTQMAIRQNFCTRRHILCGMGGCIRQT